MIFETPAGSVFAPASYPLRTGPVDRAESSIGLHQIAEEPKSSERTHAGSFEPSPPLRFSARLSYDPTQSKAWLTEPTRRPALTVALSGTPATSRLSMEAVLASPGAEILESRHLLGRHRLMLLVSL